MSKPLVLIDGSSYLFRAFHAFPPLTNAAGEPTGAILGVVNMMRKLFMDYEPDRVAVVFDAKGKNFRHDMYPEYKANRPPMPDDLREQIQPIHDILKSIGFPLVIVDGVEADDVIGTLAQQAEAQGLDVVISTGDKDMAQLVTDKVTLINTMKRAGEQLMDRDGVLEKFGVTPENIIAWLALCGDKSDNVPGIPKVGPKTAVKWLDLYGDLDGVVENQDNIKGKVGEYLRENIDQLALSKDLVTIKCDVAIEQTMDELVMQAPDVKVLEESYSRFGFNKLMRELRDGNITGVKSAGSAKIAETVAAIGLEKTRNTSSGTTNNTATTETKAPEPVHTRNYSAILDETAFNDMLAKLKAAKLVAFDTETTGLDPIVADLVGLSFCVDAGTAWYLPVAHDYMDAPEQLDRDWVLEQLKPWFADDSITKVGHHIKYDLNILNRYDVVVNGVREDSMMASYVAEAGHSRHDMDTLADRHLAMNPIKYEAVAGKGAKQVCFSQVALEQAVEYAAEDADVTLQLLQQLQAKLSASDGLQQVYHDIEIPLIPVLARMEQHGVLVDAQRLVEQSAELEQRMVEVEMAAHNAAGRVFNLGSPKALGDILYNHMGLPVIRKTPKGAPSTAEDVLQELAEKYELPKLVIEHRSLSKLKSTYTDKLPQQINPATGRIHTSYHQATAATGRLSSSDPNLQNIPIRTAEGRRIREAFVPPEGYTLVAADYSQIELRIMAHISGDEGLLKAFSAGEDIHRFTAAQVAGIELADVTDEQRRAAKAVNFGLIYGMSAFGLAKQLGVGRGEAQEYIDSYFERYPGVLEFMETTRESARATGFVETIFGRRLYLPEINSRNYQRRQYAERTAINAPMQGSAADIIKRAMITVDQWLQDNAASEVGKGINMIMQVHDELVFEVPNDQVAAFTTIINDLMCAAAELNVPLEVGIGTGNSWDEAH